MTFLILTFIFILAAKKLNFYGKKEGPDLSQKYDIQILVKNTIVVQPNEGVQLKDRLF